MKFKQTLTIFLINFLYCPLRLFYSKQELNRAWLLGSFRLAGNKPPFCNTPDPVTNEMIDKIKDHLRSMDQKERPVYLKFLEPEFGTGAMIKQLDARFKKIDITGIEINPAYHAQAVDWYNKAKALGQNRITMFSKNFLSHETTAKYHVIIMNPPYEGNLYMKHIMHALSMLEENGILVTLLPTATYNSFSWRAIDFRMDLLGLVRERKTIGTKVCSYPVQVTMLTVINKRIKLFSTDSDYTPSQYNI